MFPRAPRRWNTRFGSFVSRYTVRRLVAELHGAGIPYTDQAVYRWLRGATSPRGDAIQVVVRASAGALTADDISRHRTEVTRWERSRQ